MFSRKPSRLREEALATPFLNLDTYKQVSSAWKVRVLQEGYCGLLTHENNEPTRCMYCHADIAYACCFRVPMEILFFEKLFTNGFQKVKDRQ